jgi:hypothetical protein
MSLKGCIKKAGKALDKDDRNYMRGLIEQGRPDHEIVNRLEQNIIKERDEVVDLLKDQGVEVKTAGEGKVSEGTLEEAEDPEGGRADGKAPEESLPGSPAVGSGVEGGSPQRGNRKSGEAKPSQTDAPSTKPLKEGPVTEGASTTPTDQAPLYFTRATADKVFNKMAESSELIARFLQTNARDTFVVGIENLYWPDKDQIHITGVTRKDSLTDFDLKGTRLNLNDPKDFAKLKQSVEHEIIHANTIGYLVKQLSPEGNKDGLKDILYLGRAIAELGIARDNGTLDTGIISSLTDETSARIDYILDQPNLERSVAEFIAIMGAETAVSQEILTILGRRQGLSENAVKRAVERLVARVKEWFDSLTDADLLEDLDVDKLSGALARTIDQGTAFREQSFEENRRYAAQLRNSFGYNSKTSEINFTRKASFDYLNFAVASMITSKLESKGRTIMGNLHGILHERFPLYADAADKAIGIYDGSPALQQFIHTVTGENVNKVKKADTLAKFAEVNATKRKQIWTYSFRKCLCMTTLCWASTCRRLRKLKRKRSFCARRYGVLTADHELSVMLSK